MRNIIIAKNVSDLKSAARSMNGLKNLGSTIIHYNNSITNVIKDSHNMQNDLANISSIGNLVFRPLYNPDDEERLKQKFNLITELNAHVHRVISITNNTSWHIDRQSSLSQIDLSVLLSVHGNTLFSFATEYEIINTKRTNGDLIPIKPIGLIQNIIVKAGQCIVFNAIYPHSTKSMPNTTDFVTKRTGLLGIGDNCF